MQQAGSSSTAQNRSNAPGATHLRRHVLRCAAPWAANDGHHPQCGQHAEQALHHLRHNRLDLRVLRPRVIQLRASAGAGGRGGAGVRQTGVITWQPPRQGQGGGNVLSSTLRLLLSASRRRHPPIQPPTWRYVSGRPRVNRLLSRVRNWSCWSYTRATRAAPLDATTPAGRRRQHQGWWAGWLSWQAAGTAATSKLRAAAGVPLPPAYPLPASP